MDKNLDMGKCQESCDVLKFFVLQNNSRMHQLVDNLAVWREKAKTWDMFKSWRPNMKEPGVKMRYRDMDKGWNHQANREGVLNV